ncbi:MAG: hypothetical protein KatS3mg111_2255 [Pirellulaceae bacterium]|nr:MAG: hypothetical protein KatS3mg111_2255 [Pirellulaceae bacterium]
MLLLSLALVVPLALAFWFVLEVVANGLVMQTTRQVARDYARAIIAWRHVDRHDASQPKTVFPTEVSLYSPEQYAILRQRLVDNPEYVVKFLMLDREVQHFQLDYSERPADPDEEALLQGLQEQFRERLARWQEVKRQYQELLASYSSPEPEEVPPAGAAPTPEVAPRTDNRESAPDGAPQAESASSPPARSPLPPADPRLETLAARARDLERSLETLYAEIDGPYYPTAPEIAQRTPDHGWYAYYHVVHFPDSCFPCHQKFAGADAEEIPFRVVKVLIPYEQTLVASTMTLAVMISIAMVTIATTLAVVHFIMRRIVLRPLHHLRSVVDEISRGNTHLRAAIDTEDEFRDLAEAFNRMLRHLTDNEAQLRQLNLELDRRIDEIAKKNLELHEANRLKSDFLANMSHELRTPLNSIIGFADVLCELDTLNDRQRRYAENIKKSGQTLLEMINDILDLAKVEAGKMQVTPTSFNVCDLIEAQCDLMRPLAKEKNIDLVVECGTSLPNTVFQDRPKIQQILTNLLSNAVKFTPDGGLITVRAEALGTRLFQIEVSDTGVGIPEVELEVIFEKFRQSSNVVQHDGMTREYTGTGLGLSIVRELCHLLGGEVHVHSQLGTGSSFRVLLPIQYSEHLRQAIARV